MANDAINTVMRMKNIPGIPKSILFILSSMANKEKGYTCFPSLQSLCDSSGFGKTTVKNALNLLLKKELIGKNVGTGRSSNSYKLMFMIYVNKKEDFHNDENTTEDNKNPMGPETTHKNNFGQKCSFVGPETTHKRFSTVHKCSFVGPETTHRNSLWVARRPPGGPETTPLTLYIKHNINNKKYSLKQESGSNSNNIIKLNNIKKESKMEKFNELEFTPVFKKEVIKFSDRDYIPVFEKLERLARISKTFDARKAAAALTREICDRNINPKLTMVSISDFTTLPSLNDIMKKNKVNSSQYSPTVKTLEKPQTKHDEPLQKLYDECAMEGTSLARRKEIFVEISKLGSLQSSERIRSTGKS